MQGSLVPGQVIADKYVLEEPLGEGAGGVVFAERHVTLGERVALKFLRPDTVHGHGPARLVREARSAARLKGEHVARVFDVATLPNGAPYVVMELLEGQDLASLLRARGALPVREA